MQTLGVVRKYFFSTNTRLCQISKRYGYIYYKLS